LIGGVEHAPFNEHTFATAKIDSFLVEALKLRVFVAVGEEEEQALDLYARAVVQQFLQTSGTKIRKTAEQGIDLFKRLGVGQLVEEFEYRSLRRGERQWPIPLPPGELRYIAAAKARNVKGLAFIDIPFNAADAFRNGLVFEEPPVIVIDKFDR
jgi:hypothetical protein